MVAVAGSFDVPVWLDRRMIEIAVRSIRGSVAAAIHLNHPAIACRMLTLGSGPRFAGVADANKMITRAEYRKSYVV